MSALPVTIRPFRPGDEAALRRICIQTGLLGEPLDPVFPDTALAADILVGCYYTLEPQSCRIASDETGRVIGYLAGCLDTDSFMRACRLRAARRLLRALFAGGHLFKPASWRFARFAIRYGRLQNRLETPFSAAYPSHLHINLDAAARSQGAGSALMTAFLDYAARAGSRGVHLTTASGQARRFFEKHGFRVVAESGFEAFPRGDLRRLSLMVRSIANSE